MTDTLDDITTALQNYIVAPLNAFGLGGFIFDVEGESVATLSADITDHYTEDNRALQDHIAIKPKRITLKGYVGELLSKPTENNASFLQTVPQKLTELSAFLPTLSAAATQIESAIADPLASVLTLTSAANIYSVVKNSLSAVGPQSKQQNAYAYFQALQSQGILMGVQTPWEFIANMAIETITAIQDDTTKYITDFSVTFKQIRIASTQTLAFNATSAVTAALQGAAALQCTPQNPLGIVPGLGLPYSGLPGAQSIMDGAHALASVPGLSNLFSLAG